MIGPSGDPAIERLDQQAIAPMAWPFTMPDCSVPDITITQLLDHPIT